MAAELSVAAQRWPHRLNDLIHTISHRLARPETRHTAGDLLRGLLAPLARKNCWTLAEHVGHPSPYRFQHLLGRASVDAEGLIADLHAYARTHLGDQDTVLVVDETGDLKKGTATVGVQRQSPPAATRPGGTPPGTAGRIENAQIAVYLAYATPTGHALIDHRLYLPRSWTDEPERLQTASVPNSIVFATKPELAQQMVTAAVAAGTPAPWVTADEVYGQHQGLRQALEEHQIGYVMAVPRTERISLPRRPATVAELAVLAPASAWQRRSAASGAKGERFYDWMLIDAELTPEGYRWVLMRRHRNSGELAFYRCYAPQKVPLQRLVAVAGRRWAVEEGFQQGKGLAGLDEHQVRTWTSWQRWSLFSMLAYAFLAAMAAIEGRQNPPTGAAIALTCNEIAHLLNALFTTEPDIEHVLGWSLFRRSHQATARQCHYRRQAIREL
ncbi:SRSO17 transposase [Nocardiopsis arvandica]|uniref:SRSO17 transposase n=1 Tax=Nocardiopsis sinuspersici TaxID=501010 RepID=A0A7Z0BJF6_9ACTN|nr:SRSO17 transposase [Nocardiopsis sinuspersici]